MSRDKTAHLFFYNFFTKPVDKSGIMSYTNQTAQMEQMSKAEKLEKHEKTY